MYRALLTRQSNPMTLLRPRMQLVRGNASSAANAAKESASSAASTAKSAASSASSSAKETASSAQAKAQETASKAFAQFSGFTGRVGAKVGDLLGAYREPITYNLAVAKEFFKQVYIREGLAPPTNVNTITSTYKTLFERARDVQYWQSIAKSGEWAKVGVYGLEAYFVFHIGEIIGRRSLVGYSLDGPKEEEKH